MGKPEEFMKMIEREAEPMARDILHFALESHERRKETVSQTTQEVISRWPRGWEFYEATIYACQQNGLMLLDRAGEANDDHSSMRDALCFIYCAACLIFQEIHTLLLSGFWGGAAGRWRSLHELAVTATVIANQDPEFAQRYLDHGFVVQTHRLVAYYEAHGRGPVEPQELAERRAHAESLAQKHQVSDAPRRFRDSYGWAASLMPMNKDGTKRVPPTFDRLEAMAGQDDLRLLVMSSHGLVHADSAGVATAVLGDGGWALGPTVGYANTVARPALLSMLHVIGATHLGYEPEFNEFAQRIGLCAASAMKLAGWGAEAFPAPSEEEATGQKRTDAVTAADDDD